ncbi:acyltransferase, partial [Pseudomonas sp. O11]|uniref:acyltransferase n=1 Tax=Pseudomonas sp. O11 TaxID=3159446 RepID=UPI00387AF2A6
SGKTLTNPTVPSDYKIEAKSAVYIGRHVIIGTNSIVIPGVHLADGCSVGAMSMVTKSTEEWGIYFGIPAKRIKNRSRQLLDLEAEYLASEIK